MQSNQAMPNGQFMEQNNSIQRGYIMQSNIPNQRNYQNTQVQNDFQMQPNTQEQHNFQMQYNQQMPLNQQIPTNSNPQVQQNRQMQYTTQIPQNQQNFQMQQNQQIQENPQILQNFQMQQNQQIQGNPQNPQNFQMQQNHQIQENPEMQQLNSPLSGSQSRPLPPPIPRNSSQNLYPSMQHIPSQRIPLRATSSSNGSNCQTTLQQSMQFNSMASMQSIGSSNSEEFLNQSQQQQQQQQYSLSRQSSSQILPVVYNNITYNVDPELLSNASPKVKDMLLPFIQENRLTDACIEIMDHNFTYRNINNFLKLCQGLPTDVENSEMEEICEIAKMFGAEKIYNIGVTFIRENMDPNFSVPDSKYDGSDGKKYIRVEDNQNIINHSSEMLSNMVNENENQNENENNVDDDESEKDDQVVVGNEVKQNSLISTDTSNKESEDSKTDDSHPSSIIYTVRVEKHALRCPIFHFYDEKDCLFTAKQKDENIYIGEGFDVHIKSNQKNHVAHISQDNCFHNIIFLKNKTINLKYVDSGKPNHLSIHVTFPLNEDKMVTWSPKPPKYDPVADKYYLNFNGEHHHTPMKSKKNIVLQNDNGHPTFIVRKMYNEKYEIECLPLVDPLIAFIIGLSDIVGPYMDPLAELFT